MTKLFQHILIIVTVALISLLVVPTAQATSQINAYFFYGDGCPHCAKERVLLNELTKGYPNLNIVEYEIYHNIANNLLLQRVAGRLHVQSGGVPFLVIGDKSYVGFVEGITSEEIKDRISECTENDCKDIMVTPPSATPNTDTSIRDQKEITLPIIGPIDVNKLSLPMLTIILAFIDGFNPCAMWVLIFLISLLLGLKDKKRMWILGSTFIIVSALVYFLFMTAWLNLFLFLGYVSWIRYAIGLVALAAGYYYLKDYLINTKGGCSVVGDENRQQIFRRIQQITSTRRFTFALGGIILLAIAVNIVELVCSAGLPAIYTKILSLSNLSVWQYYLYLLLYIIVFMLDDLFIFVTAMVTLQTIGIQSKYSRYSHLIGGVLMFVIGLFLFFKPEWLMFG